MDGQSPRTIRKSCSLNLGFCRVGSLRLHSAFKHFRFSVHQDSFSGKQNRLKGLLFYPEHTVRRWWTEDNGKAYVLNLVRHYDFIFDGWLPFVLFLPDEDLLQLQSVAAIEGIKLNFVATTRDVDSYVSSELHHWVRHNMESESALNYEERRILDSTLRERFLAHTARLNSLTEYSSLGKRILDPLIHVLPLGSRVPVWADALASFSWPSKEEWTLVLETVHRNDSSPSLPVEGILITFRIENNWRVSRKLHAFLERIEEDRLCHYLVVIALDYDEFHSTTARSMIHSIASRSRVMSVDTLQNPARDPEDPFQLCQIWHSMAEVAWSRGADWTVLFGDDILMECPFHYRSIYRSFLDISQRLNCPFGFGSPWLNDESFPGFPTFPVISKVHRQIFGGLIPYHRGMDFVNQDLDPYLHRLYSKFNAAPLLSHVRIQNNCGGDNSTPARYRRVPTIGWRDWVVEDTIPIQKFLELNSTGMKEELVLVDVVIPTYRLQLEYLRRLFVDNPELLVDSFSAEGFEKRRYTTTSIALAAKQLENDLRKHSFSGKEGIRNSVRVRFNTSNSGASASRNVGLEESSAEYVLFLDDDVIPDPNLLRAYEGALLSVGHSSTEVANDSLPGPPTLLGLVGLVRFPRSSTMPLKHAAVLSSQLNAIFEIAESKSHTTPAWGVTANLMVKRLPNVRFDESYAKTGGGEDIDFCLNLLKCGGYFKAVEGAVVTHEFWEGSAVHLAKRFSRWALSDAKIFNRFPEHRYLSWPNVVECLLLTLFWWVISFSLSFSRVFVLLVGFVAADMIVDVFNYELYLGRRAAFQHPRSRCFSMASQLLGNCYIIAVESGRLLGHLRTLNWQNIFCRYDWHCGRLPCSVRKYRTRELRKFILFLIVTVTISALQ